MIDENSVLLWSSREAHVLLLVMQLQLFLTKIACSLTLSLQKFRSLWHVYAAVLWFHIIPEGL